MFKHVQLVTIVLVTMLTDSYNMKAIKSVQISCLQSTISKEVDITLTGPFAEHDYPLYGPDLSSQPSSLLGAPLGPLERPQAQHSVEVF